MSDFLVNLGANKTARKAIGTLGLPIPLPQKLERSDLPWTDRPCENRAVIVGQTRSGKMADALAQTLAVAGAQTFVVGDAAQLKPYAAQGEAWGRKPETLAVDETNDGKSPYGLLFDATGMKEPSQLWAVYEFFHNRIRSLARCGRAVILADTPKQIDSPAASATARALEGFVRSLGREIGKRGATATVLYVDKEAESRVEPVLRFVLSSRSAYVSGQPIHVSMAVAGDAPYPYRRPLDGKVALVTGAARGIGAKIAMSFAREGAKVIVVDRPAEDAHASKVAEQINGALLLCDITDEKAPDTMKKFIADGLGKLDIVVHNAGVTRDKTLANMDADRWNMVMDVNLIGLIRLNEALLPTMQKGGRILCLSSIAGISGNFGQTNYSTSKAGVIGYVQALAKTVAKKGITVNAVAPGFIETQMTAAIPLATREVARRLCNLSQGGLPEDIAEVLTFLASPGAVGMTGEVLRICGGNYVGA